MAVATGLFSRIRDQRSVCIVGDGALDVPKTMKFAYAYGESPTIRDQRSHTTP